MQHSSLKARPLQSIGGFSLPILLFSILSLPLLLRGATAAHPPAGVPEEAWSRIADTINGESLHFAQIGSASNLRHNLAISFSPEGVGVRPDNPAVESAAFPSSGERAGPAASPSWSLHFRLAGYGYGGDLRALGKPDTTVKGNRLTRRYGPLEEWYRNGRAGLEQGFTLERPPTTAKERRLLRFALDFSTGLLPHLSEDGQSLHFRDHRNNRRLNFDHLLVIDAAGRVLPARFEMSNASFNAQKNRKSPNRAFRLAILVDDSRAVYPIVVDPLLSNEIAKVFVGDTVAGDNFGDAVAISGDTLVVGAPLYDRTDLGAGLGLNAGTAYVFSRNAGGADNWGQIKQLFPSVVTEEDQFGFSVAIDGDIILVASPFSDDPVAGSGSVFVFQRNEGGTDNWGEADRLVANDAAEVNFFGFSVAISGDLLVVGAPFGSGNETGRLQRTGSAYIFSRDSGLNTWRQETEIFDNVTIQGTIFGWSNSTVAIDGTTIVVGTPFFNLSENGSAFVFEPDPNNPPKWMQVVKLEAGDSQTQIINQSLPSFGKSVGISGDRIAVGADSNDEGGAAYLYERNALGADQWGEVVKLSPFDGSPAGSFGISIAIDGDTVVVGDNTTVLSGGVYIFQKNEGGVGRWGQSAKLLASDGDIMDQFGEAVDFDFDVGTGKTTIAVGAPKDEPTGGSAYLFALPSTTTSALDLMVLEDDPDSVVDLFAAFGSGSLPNDPQMLTYAERRNTDVSIVATTMDNTTGVLTLGYQLNANGIVNLLVNAADSSGNTVAAATFLIEVVPVNDPPIAVDDAFTVTEDSGTTTLDVLADKGNGADSDVENDPLNVIAVGTPDGNGSAVIAGNNINYTPFSNFNGIETFTYTLSDGALAATATVTINVTAVNDNPTTTGLADVVVDENSSPALVFLIEAFDDIEDGPSGLTYTVSSNTNPGLVSTGITEGNLTLTFSTGATGAADITIRGTDSGDPGLFVEASFMVTVNPLGLTLPNWRAQFFSSADLNDPNKEATVWGDLADPDEDGLSNLLEYFMGLNPILSDANAAFSLAVTGNNLVFTYHRGKDRIDAAGSVEWSNDLINWFTTGVTEQVVQTLADAEVVEATIPIDAAEIAKFIRLKVVGP